jgi:hypothetical protein
MSTVESPEPRPTLGVTDLVNIAQIIQLATSRGSWKTEELSTVGNTYDKLIAFLEAAGAVTRSAADDTAPSTETVAEPKEKKNAKARGKTQ